MESQLLSLVEAIKSSDVVETRIQLLTKLGDLAFHENSDLCALLECLTIFWEDFTCLDASQCSLNKTILHVAAKYVNSDLSGCLLQFLALGTKASKWCGKHLKMTIMSSEESQEEEHSNLFFQLLVDFLSFSANVIEALTRYGVFADCASVDIVEKFITEQLNLTKDIASEIKIIISFAPELLKVVHKVIDTLMSLCKDYSSSVSWSSCNSKPEKNNNSIDCEPAFANNHVINVMKLTIERLCELGVLAANDGGSLVTILNMSWKGVVSLLQLGKGAMTKIIDVENIILTLISLVNAPLRCAADAWSSSLKDTVSIAEARRIFLPVKFYLINVVKISSLYPFQAYQVYKEITHCILIISTFGILLSSEKLLNNTCEVFSELLERTCVDLLHSLLNSSEVKNNLKLEILDWIFSYECCSDSADETSGSYCGMNSMVEIFSKSCETMPRMRVFILGQVALFHTLLRYSVDLQEDVKLKLAKKLQWLLDNLVEEEVYSSILQLQIPVPYGSGKTLELVWQPVFSVLLDALKTFIIVVSSSLAWVEVEYFLVENLFHPHFLCWEILIELWCFLFRNAQEDTMNDIVEQLCSVMKLLASPESVFIPGSPLRKTARIVCLLLSYCTSLVEHVYISVMDERSQLSSVLFGALILEGFPLNSLSDNIRTIAKQKIITDYFGFTGCFDDILSNNCSSDAFGLPVFMLSASLQFHQVTMSDVDIKTLKFLIAILHKLRDCMDKLSVRHCEKLLSETLMIISNVKSLYESDMMEEVILELQYLFVSGPGASNAQLSVCKPYLALFIGGLGGMEMAERDDCAKSCGVWELYHMLFREKHWALVHLAIAAFGYFAARTSCNQLWRFVPPNAALSYDIMSGKETNEERFMSELKAFLEKEKALTAIAPGHDQIESLVKEGILLKEIVQKTRIVRGEAMRCESMEIEADNLSNKRRKLPDGISRGIELVQSGLKVIGEGLSEWQLNHLESSELHDNLLSQLSHLEKFANHLRDLAGS